MRQITIDNELCMGTGMCTVAAPRTFGLDDEDHAVVIDPVGDSDDRIDNAATGCPMAAIELGTLPSAARG